MGRMNARSISILFLLILCGCRTPPAELEGDFRREGHPAFTTEEQKIVVAARRHVEQLCHKRIDAYYRVRHTAEGYSVTVFEVGRYVHKQPRSRAVGGIWGVDLKEDGTVTGVLQSLE